MFQLLGIVVCLILINATGNKNVHLIASLGILAYAVSQAFAMRTAYFYVVFMHTTGHGYYTNDTTSKQPEFDIAGVIKFLKRPRHQTTDYIKLY